MSSTNKSSQLEPTTLQSTTLKPTTPKTTTIKQSTLEPMSLKPDSMALVIYRKHHSIEDLINAALASTIAEALDIDQNLEGFVRHSEQETCPSLSAMPAEVILNILEQTDNRNQQVIMSICLGLTSTKFYALCKAYWEEPNPDFAVDSLPSCQPILRTCYCGRRDDIADCSGVSRSIFEVDYHSNCTGKKLHMLMENWFGPKYFFVCVDNEKGGCFVNGQVYGLRPYSLSDDDRDDIRWSKIFDLECRWKDYSRSWDREDDVWYHLLPRPFNYGEEWWEYATQAILADVRRHYDPREWVEYWMPFKCFRKLIRHYRDFEDRSWVPDEADVILEDAITWIKL